MTKTTSTPKLVTDGNGNVKKKAAGNATVTPITPATATPPAAPPPAASAPAAPNTGAAYEGKLRKLPLHKQIAHRARNVKKRFARFAEAMAAWTDAPAACAAVTATVASLDQLVKAIEALPATFVPPAAPDKPKTGGAKSGIAIGAKVKLSEKGIKSWGEVVDPEDRTGLTVVSAKAGKVVCKAASGGKIALPRNALELEVAPATAEATS